MANGVNVQTIGEFTSAYIFDEGKPSNTIEFAGTDLNLNQNNFIKQVSGGGADLDEYRREGYDVIIDADAQYKQTRNLAINNELEYATIEGELHRFTYDGKVTVDGVYNEETGETTGYGQGFVGQGFAAYGSEDWNETASAECSQETSGSSSNYATDSGGTTGDPGYPDSSWYDLTSGGQSENSQASGGSYDWSDTYNAEAGAAGFNGAGCAAGDGASCTGSQSATTTYAWVDATYLKDVFNLEASEETSLDVDVYAKFRAPIFIEEAEAEYIVVDDSALTVNSAYGISLSGSAQSNLQGLNVVTAAGGQVANGVNVSTGGNMDGVSMINLNQSNFISQTH
ncbi:MAG: hypothetical protein HUN05_16170 [Desulfobacter sp.]|nr:MAG: hypothetical protein HUN05_16170 [Desulfobacter sp.]